MRTPEGTTIWYLRVINHIAQSGDVWTLDIHGEEWGEGDFPQDVDAARELTALGRGREGMASAPVNRSPSASSQRADVGLLLGPTTQGALRIAHGAGVAVEHPAWRPDAARAPRARIRPCASIPLHRKAPRLPDPATDRACRGSASVSAACSRPRPAAVRRRRSYGGRNNLAGQALTRQRRTRLAFTAPAGSGGDQGSSAAEHLAEVRTRCCFGVGSRRCARSRSAEVSRRVLGGATLPRRRSRPIMAFACRRNTWRGGGSAARRST